MRDCGNLVEAPIARRLWLCTSCGQFYRAVVFNLLQPFANQSGNTHFSLPTAGYHSLKPAWLGLDITATTCNKLVAILILPISKKDLQYKVKNLKWQWKVQNVYFLSMIFFHICLKQSSGLDWTLWLAMLASFFALSCCSSSRSLVWVLHLVTVTPFNNSNWFKNYKNDNCFCWNFFQQTISTKLNEKHIAFPLKKVSHVLTVNLYLCHAFITINYTY